MRCGLLSLLIVLFGCNEEDDGLFSIHGTVVMDGNPLAGSTVTVDEKANFSDETDATGAFSIRGLAAGDHLVVITKTFQPEVFGTETSLTAEKHIDIGLNEDIDLGEIDLPKPTVLVALSPLTHSSATLRWHSTPHEEFRLYIIYRHTSADFSDETATKIYAAASRLDTMFTDNTLTAKTTYYYRLYTMFGPGTRTLSNTLSITTENVQALKNGSFETVQSNGVPQDWQLYKNVTTELEVDRTTASAGANSLKFTHTLTDGCYELLFRQRINRALLEPGGRYKLRFKYRSNFTGDENVMVIKGFGSEWLPDYFPISFEASAGWKDFEAELVIPESLGANDMDLTIDFCIPRDALWWLDELSLTKV